MIFRLVYNTDEKAKTNMMLEVQFDITISAGWPSPKHFHTGVKNTRQEKANSAPANCQNTEISPFKRTVVEGPLTPDQLLHLISKLPAQLSKFCT